MIMIVLQWLFPPFHKKEEETQHVEAIEICPPMEMTEEEEIAAAIAVAIQYLRAEGYQGLGKNLESGPGPFWAARPVSSSSLMEPSNRSKR